MTIGRTCTVIAALGQLAIPLWAQTSEDGSAMDSSAEWRRIESEQATVEMRYQQDTQACYARFAVNTCLDEAKARRRTHLDDLKRQSQLLKAAQRKLQGAEQAQRVERKLAQEPLPRAAVPARSGEARPAPSPAAATSRASRPVSAPADEREAASRREHEARLQRQQQALGRQAEAAQLAASREQAFEARRKQAELRRESLERRLRERPRPRASPLPDPAASALGQGSRP
jgi:colicin import membrane protein